MSSRKMTFSTTTSPVRPPIQMSPTAVSEASWLTLLLPLAIELIESRREPNPEMDAIYILSPEPFAVDCLLADYEMRRYRSSYLVWTGLLDPSLRRKIDDFPGARQLRSGFQTLFIDFVPRESHLVTFKDPWSFPMLYHPSCNALVPQHMKSLAQKVGRQCAPARIPVINLENRSLAFVLPSENTPRSDTTSPRVRFTKRASSAHTWLDSCKKSWMAMRNGIPTSRLPRNDRKRL